MWKFYQANASPHYQATLRRFVNLYDYIALVKMVWGQSLNYLRDSEKFIPHLADFSDLWICDERGSA
jgi:hypothetical protein